MTESAAVRNKRVKNSRVVCMSDLTVLHTLGIRVKSDTAVCNLFKIRCSSEVEELKNDFMKSHQAITATILANNPEADLTEENTLREAFLDEYFQVSSQNHI